MDNLVVNRVALTLTTVMVTLMAIAMDTEEYTGRNTPVMILSAT